MYKAGSWYKLAMHFGLIPDHLDEIDQVLDASLNLMYNATTMAITGQFTHLQSEVQLMSTISMTGKVQR